jgi:hypothetical protein
METARMRLFLCALSCVALAAGPCLAATVEPSQGSLSINHGQGFEPVGGPTTANVGDSLMVAPGGTATVVYDDGCKVTVQPEGVTTIAPLSPCASGSYAQNSDFSWGGVAMGVVAGGLTGLGIYEATQTPSGSGAPVSP